MIPYDAINFGVAQMSVVTVCTILVIGLGFTTRPSRAYLLWAFAFLLALLSSYASIAAELDEHNEPLRVFALGLLLGVPPLLWSGLRAQRDVRTYGWVGPLAAVVFGALLAAASSGGLYPIAFRSAFLCSGIFAALCAWELRLGRRRRSRFALPMLIASVAYAGVALIGFSAGIVVIVSGITDDLTATRALNNLGVMVYSICITVTILTLSNDRRGAGSISSDPRPVPTFSAVASDRLERARARRERSWSVVSLRFDDVDDIRDAAGEAVFRSIQARLSKGFLDRIGADADLARGGDGVLVALIPAAPAPVRRTLHALLDDIADTREDLPLSVRLTASAGLVGVESAGYDLEDLERAAHEARCTAFQAGGNRVAVAEAAVDR